MAKQVCSKQNCSSVDHLYAFSPVLSLYLSDNSLTLENNSTLDKVVYASNGSVLNRFCLKNGTAIITQQICPFKQKNSCIFGIVPSPANEKRLAIYGEKSLVLYHDDYPCRPISPTNSFKEWIQMVHFLSNGNLVVLFGCNAAALFHVKWLNSQNTAELKEIVRVQSKHKAVLSHAIMFGTEWENLKTFVGTAFGDILISMPAQGSSVLHRLSSHTGMIFGLCLTDKNLFSISDDRKLVMWDIENYVLVDHVYGHSTRPFAVCQGTNGIVITGCKDSYIYIWSTKSSKLSLLQNIALGRGSVRSLLVFENVLLVGTETGFFGSISLSQSNGIKSFRFMHDVAIRNFCCISPELLYFIDDNGELYKKWGKAVNKVPGLKFCKAEFVSVSNCRKFMTIADLQCCWLIDIGNELEVSQVELETNARLLSCHWSSDNFFLFYSNGTVKHFIASASAGLLKEAEFNIGMKHCASAVLVVKGNVIIGTKKGKILFVQHGQVQSISNAHNKETVTDLIIYHHNLYSVGRDGKICKWDCGKDFSTRIKLVESERPSQTVAIEWPCKLLIYGNSLYIAGFHGAVFYLVKHDTGQCVCQFTCGGGHRNWEILMLEKWKGFEGQYCYLRFINKGCLIETVLKLNEMTVFMPNAHISTITAICCLVSKSGNSTVMTSSFDTTIAISSISNEHDNKKSPLSMLYRFRAHTSSVYSLSSLRNYAVSAGGKSELCLWSLQQDQSLLKVGQIRLDSDCRLISVSLYSLKPLSSIVSGSDGRLLMVNWLDKFDNTAYKMLELHGYVAKQYLYTKVCAIKESEQVTVFAVTTAGVLVFWPDITAPSNFSEYFLEKAGLSAVDGKNQGLSSVAVVGSESGCITSVKISVGSVDTDRTYWHGATCTDLKFFTKSGNTYVISTSIDCRLAIFQYDDSSNKLTFCRAVTLNVADPSSICLLKDSTDDDTTIVVVGFGLQGIQISTLL
uniref:tRNA (34-2'-O)-methyltransferase regulator WDR6 n=1 Tax=Syphacia muris TaxID=451379 RepID=A0A0N5AW98_9BILA